MSGYKESIPDPSVMRTEMERGPAFQVVINSRIYKTISVTILFETKKDVADFEDWYLHDIKRAAFFAFKHPRTGEVVQARFPGGKIGDYVPVTSGFGVSTMTAELEYMV